MYNNENNQKLICAVYSKKDGGPDDGLYRVVLQRGEYQENGHQIKLPPNHYSRGFYERMSDGNWNDLKWLYPEQEAMYKK